jgi:transcriptional regulator with XRE-family HTH domain
MSNIGNGRPRTGKYVSSPLVEHLRRVRIAKGMSQDQLSELLGYSLGTLQAWEVGKMSPTLRHLNDWCQGLGLELRVYNIETCECTVL